MDIPCDFARQGDLQSDGHLDIPAGVLGHRLMQKRSKGGRFPAEITKEEISQYFHLPSDEAARRLGIGLTVLKSRCRKLGIQRWPFRKVKQINRMCTNVENGTAAGKETAKLKEVMSKFLTDHGAQATVLAATAPSEQLSPVSSGFRQQQSQSSFEAQQSQLAAAAVAVVAQQPPHLVAQAAQQLGAADSDLSLEGQRQSLLRLLSEHGTSATLQQQHALPVRRSAERPSSAGFGAVREPAPFLHGLAGSSVAGGSNEDMLLALSQLAQAAASRSSNHSCTTNNSLLNPANLLKMGPPVSQPSQQPLPSPFQGTGPPAAGAAAAGGADGSTADLLQGLVHLAAPLAPQASRSHATSGSADHHASPPPKVDLLGHIRELESLRAMMGSSASGVVDQLQANLLQLAALQNGGGSQDSITAVAVPEAAPVPAPPPFVELEAPRRVAPSPQPAPEQQLLEMLSSSSSGPNGLASLLSGAGLDETQVRSLLQCAATKTAVLGSQRASSGMIAFRGALSNLQL